MWQARKKETGPFLSNIGSKSRPQGTGNTSGVGTVQSCVILAEHLGNRTSLLRLFARYPDSCWALASCCSSATVHRKRSTRLLQRAMWFGLESVSTGLHHLLFEGPILSSLCGAASWTLFQRLPIVSSFLCTVSKGILSFIYICFPSHSQPWYRRWWWRVFQDPQSQQEFHLSAKIRKWF